MTTKTATKKKLSKVTFTVFVESEINKLMHCMDFTDSGMKMFGSFQGLELTTYSKVDDAYYEKMTKKLIESGKFGMVMMGSRYAIKKGVKMLSLGTHFVFVDDIVKQLKENGVKEIDYNND